MKRNVTQKVYLPVPLTSMEQGLQNSQKANRLSGVSGISKDHSVDKLLIVGNSE